MRSSRRAVAVVAASMLLAACGSSDGDSPATTSAPVAGASGPAAIPTQTPPAVASAPGGLYVGYYLEDADTNPQDPTAGAFTLTLPDGNAGFAGSLFFTYIGCQSSNVGRVSGSKTGNALSASFEGTVDGLPQSGRLNGSYDSTSGAYTGTYLVAGGLQRVRVPGCIDYFIGPNGTWALLPVGRSQPSSFSVQASAAQVSWTPPPGASAALVAVIDQATATTGGADANVAQRLVPASAATLSLTGLRLASGRSYVALVAVVDANTSRLAFGSTALVAP